MQGVLAVIFHPPQGLSPLERLVGDARAIAALDLVDLLRTSGIEPLLVAPRQAEQISHLVAASVETILSPSDREFHFGEALVSLVRDRSPRGLLFFGSGSGILLSNHQIAELAAFSLREEPGAVLNNFYSCDFAAIAAPHMLTDLPLPARDNPLGFALADGGIPCQTMTRSASTQFDIDTPTDLFILKSSEQAPTRLLSFLDDLTESHPTLDRIYDRLTERTAHVGLLGRVSPTTWSDVEGSIACRTSGFAEGRGMRSSGSTHTPFLARAIRSDGAHAFFRRLADAADAAVIDTRPFLAESGALPSADVRFASDLFRTDEITNPVWRSFTQAAAEAPIPVLLGGHSIVSGGLYLMADACWKGRSLSRRLHPEPFESDKEPR